jgi:UDP-N-acetylmuramate dehydrogenase
MKSHPPLTIQHNIRLAPLTTIGLGGNARLFASCQTLEHLREALAYAHDQNLRVHIMGGGSNVVFSDSGFDGLVIRIELKGTSYVREGEAVLVAAAAGEGWDAFVDWCVGRHLGGIECLSGIPGLVGATPIQNVGAYGQEVRDTIVSVKAVDRNTLQNVEFANSDCRFGYRQSRFKADDAEKYIVTEVTFQLHTQGRAEIRYPELREFIASSRDVTVLPDGEPALRTVREAVLTLRRRKSMLVDPHDPHSRSVGSFFMNPIVSMAQFGELQSRLTSSGGTDQIPAFPSGDRVKIPAAWLVEHAGFFKGYRTGGVGVSQNHSLALVNYGGTTRELLELASRIQNAVHERYGIVLEREPALVPS